MKCEVCKDTTRINWGSGSVVLCQKHSDSNLKFNEHPKQSVYKHSAIFSLLVTLLLILMFSPIFLDYFGYEFDLSFVFPLLKWKLVHTIPIGVTLIFVLAIGSCYLQHNKNLDHGEKIKNRILPSINNIPDESTTDNSSMIHEINTIDQSPVIIKPDEWSLELLKEIDWKVFEDLCANFFKAKGRKADVTNLGADEGIDIILYQSNHPEKILGVVQCKAWKKKLVSVKDIRELLGIMTDKGCPLGVFITIAGYTNDALKFASDKNIRLLDGKKLLEQIYTLDSDVQLELLNQATIGDYKTPSCPRCGIKLIKRDSKYGKIFWGCKNFPQCRYTMNFAK